MNKAQRVISLLPVIEANRIPVDRDGNELLDMDDNPVPVNKDGTITLYHRTSPEKAAKIRRTGNFKSLENTDETFFSTKLEGQAVSYGDAVITVKIRPSFVRINDAFHSGEVHVAVKNTLLTLRNIIPEGLRDPAIDAIKDRNIRNERKRL